MELVEVCTMSWSEPFGSEGGSPNNCARMNEYIRAINERRLACADDNERWLIEEIAGSNWIGQYGYPWVWHGEQDGFLKAVDSVWNEELQKWVRVFEPNYQEGYWLDHGSKVGDWTTWQSPTTVNWWLIQYWIEELVNRGNWIPVDTYAGKANPLIAYEYFTSTYGANADLLSDNDDSFIGTFWDAMGQPGWRAKSGKDFHYRRIRPYDFGGPWIWEDIRKALGILVWRIYPMSDWRSRGELNTLGVDFSLGASEEFPDGAPTKNISLADWATALSSFGGTVETVNGIPHGYGFGKYVPRNAEDPPEINGYWTAGFGQSYSYAHAVAPTKMACDAQFLVWSTKLTQDPQSVFAPERLGAFDINEAPLALEHWSDVGTVGGSAADRYVKVGSLDRFDDDPATVGDYYYNYDIRRAAVIMKFDVPGGFEFC